jgi:DNA invertase Pin-like site-specific DNA recombinase
LPPDYPHDISYRTTFTGQELTRIPIPCRRDRFTDTTGPDGNWPTPEPPHRINQIFLEPILFTHAERQPNVEILNRTVVEDVEIADETATATLRDLESGAAHRSRFRFVVGCSKPTKCAHSPQPPIRRLIGYARVSTEDQATDAQVDELKAAGCRLVQQEHGSGASSSRPVLANIMRDIAAGDVLVVVRLDRLARSVSHLLEVIERLEERGAHFRSLRDPIDTSTPQGMFSLQVLGAVAQLERALIAERTKAGMKAAIARGKLPGNPGLRDRWPEAIRAVSAARERLYLDELITSAQLWLPTVRRMRPQHSWDDVVRVLNSSGHSWTIERLRRAVHRLVRERIAEPALIERSPRRPPEDRLMTLVAGIAIADPDLTLRDIAGQLEQMHERTPRGGRRWQPSSVKALLDRARRLGLVAPDPAPGSETAE